MTSNTQMMEYIEHYSITIFLEALQHPKFNPNDGLRNNSFILQTVIYNNFPAFKALINHPKFNKTNNKLLNNNLINKDNNYIYRIIKKVDLCDIPDTRQFLEELYNHNVVIPHGVVQYCKNTELALELFDKIEKTFDNVSNILTNNCSGIGIFEHIFKYLITHFPNLMTKEYIDNNYLKNIYSTDAFIKLDILYKNGIDISLVNNLNPILIILKNFQYKYHNSKPLNTVKTFMYLMDNNITYNEDIIKHLCTLLKLNHDSYGDDNIIINTFGGIAELKIMFTKFNEEPTNIIYNYLYNYIINNRDLYTDSNKVIDLCVKYLNNINPFDNFDNVFFSEMTIRGIHKYKIFAKECILRLVYYKFKINDLSKKFLLDKKLLTEEEINNIDNIAIDYYNKNPSTVTDVNDIKVKKGRKKNINLIV